MKHRLLDSIYFHYVALYNLQLSAYGKIVLGFKKRINNASKVKVVYVTNLYKHNALYRRLCPHTCMSLVCIRSNLELLTRLANGTATDRMEDATPLLLQWYIIRFGHSNWDARSHTHSLTIPQRVTCSLLVTVIMQLSDSLDLLLTLFQWITCWLSVTVTISMNHMFALSHCHYLNESLVRSQLLSLSQLLAPSQLQSLFQLIICSPSVIVSISMDHFLAVSYCHYFNESLARSQLLSLSQWINCSLSDNIIISTNHLLALR